MPRRSPSASVNPFFGDVYQSACVALSASRLDSQEE
jgi:hypothetical protein